MWERDAYQLAFMLLGRLGEKALGQAREESRIAEERGDMRDATAWAIVARVMDEMLRDETAARRVLH